MATKKVCIFRFNRSFRGDLNAGHLLVPQYSCGSGHGQRTDKFGATLKWDIGAPEDCDESKPSWPTGLILLAEGTVIKRDDDFAYFQSQRRCDLVKKENGAEVIYFSGKLELVFEIGSHPAPAEKCNEPKHVEGWLKVSGTTEKTKPYSLSAVLVTQWEPATAQQPHLTGGAKFKNTKLNRITGALVQSS